MSEITEVVDLVPEIIDSVSVNISSGSNITDHGLFIGLADDDHLQYHTDARGDARYSALGHDHAGVYDPAGSASAAQAAATDAAAAGLASHVGAADPHPQYLTAAEGNSAYDASGAAAVVQSALTTHAARTDNPHAVTAAQVGLGSVNNTADAAKPVSTAQAAADAAVQAFAIQRANHTGVQAISTVTGLQTELDGKQAALGFTPENLANKGVASGYAALDGSGKVPASQLPSYVDDVVEAANLAAFPGTGETGKIYVALDSNKTYRWSGSAYVEISASPGSTDVVPEGSTNLYHTSGRVNALISAAVGSVVQAYSATLTALAGLTTTAFGRSLLTLANAAALRTSVALPTSTTVGRLARYTDTAGAQEQTTGLYEDGSGNVGIGTTGPSSALEIGGAGNIKLGSGKIGFNGDVANYYIKGISNGLEYKAWSVGNFIFGSGSGNWSFTNGNVGIGTTGPGAKLHVLETNAGNPTTPVYLQNNSTSAGTQVGIGLSATNQGAVANNRFAGIYAEISGASGNGNALVFKTNSSGGAPTEQLRITPSGNVGIGTTSPSTTLHANGPIRTASYTVATLPSAATVGAGSRAYVTDATATTFASTAAGGGSSKVPVYSDGTNWLIG